ncbi:MAG: hypothetical protein HYW95_02550 [Candidatus Wildermuthbacteria bacterium]|nr:hypothetical protein [Candidatus Wildermuthbacteria bacterium]
MAEDELTIENPNMSQQKTEGGQEKARVSPFEVDFLLVFLFATIVDVVDIILEILSFLIVPKLFGIFLDAVTFVGITYWVYQKTNRIETAKERGFRGLSPQTKRRYQRKALTKALRKVGLTCAGELIPFVGLVPFWTLRVLSTLREK